MLEHQRLLVEDLAGCLQEYRTHFDFSLSKEGLGLFVGSERGITLCVHLRFFGGEIGHAITQCDALFGIVIALLGELDDLGLGTKQISSGGIGALALGSQVGFPLFALRLGLRNRGLQLVELCGCGGERG